MVVLKKNARGAQTRVPQPLQVAALLLRPGADHLPGVGLAVALAEPKLPCRRGTNSPHAGNPSVNGKGGPHRFKALWPGPCTCWSPPASPPPNCKLTPRAVGCNIARVNEPGGGNFGLQIGPSPRFPFRFWAGPNNFGAKITPIAPGKQARGVFIGTFFSFCFSFIQKPPPPRPG